MNIKSELLNICIHTVICMLNWKVVTGDSNYDGKLGLEDFYLISKSYNHFSSNLFQAYASTETQENIITSPLNALIPLSMLFYGADGDTKEELKSVLHLNSIHIQTELSNLLTKLNSTAKSEFELANAMYVDRSLILHKEFLIQYSDHLHTCIEKTDFNNSADAIRNINAWVKNKTRSKISHIISTNDIDEHTKVILLNALYFKINWYNPFEPELTEKRTFHNFDGTKVNIPTMMKKFSIPYGCIESLNATFIKIEYFDKNFEMIIILPNQKYGLRDIENNFKWNLVSKAAYSIKEIELTLPKFVIETTANLKSTLRKLGLKSIFKEAANFSRMAEKPLYINQVVQKLFVQIDEKGSELAVTTAVQMRLRRMIVDYDKFTVEHPFMFIIQHNPSSIPLIIGSVRKFTETVKDEL